MDGRPLIRLDENYGVVREQGLPPTMVFVCDHDPRYVPAAVKALGGEVRSVLYWQAGDVQIWWQVSFGDDVWQYALRTA
jgi:hypothetical protein